MKKTTITRSILVENPQVGITQDGDEDRGGFDLAGQLIGDTNPGTGVIDEQFLTGSINLAHHDVVGLLEYREAFGGGTVLQSVGTRGFVFLPQQEPGDAFLGELGFHRGEVG